MTRLTLIADVAGQLARSIAGSSRTTAAAVAIPSDEVVIVRSLIRPSFPKWGQCKRNDAEEIADILVKTAAGMAMLSWDRATPQWEAFWIGTGNVCDAITKQDRKKVSFAKPSTVARYAMIGSAMTVATSHAIASGYRTGIVDARGLELIEQTLIVDDEFSGAETRDYLYQMWVLEKPRPRTASAGFRITTKDLILAKEQDEPLLILADYLAGLVHCSLIANPGRLKLPLTQAEARAVLRPIYATRRALLRDEVFNLKSEEMFGDLGRKVGSIPR
ncbi:MAG: hypothetical protein ACT4PZ_14445 [Panacagrimonas sp.]